MVLDYSHPQNIFFRQHRQSYSRRKSIDTVVEGRRYSQVQSSIKGRGSVLVRHDAERIGILYSPSHRKDDKEEKVMGEDIVFQNQRNTNIQHDLKRVRQHCGESPSTCNEGVKLPVRHPTKER